MKLFLKKYLSISNQMISLLYIFKISYVTGTKYSSIVIISIATTVVEKGVSMDG